MAKVLDPKAIIKGQRNKYKSKYRPNYSSLFNLETAKDAKIPQEYTRETAAPFDPNSKKVVG